MIGGIRKTGQVDERQETKRIDLGGVPIGGGAPVTVQSMTNTETSLVEPTLRQIRRLEIAGCDIVRVAVPDESACRALPEIIAGTRIPVVADIHFDYRLALTAMEKGTQGIRINPGTLGGRKGIAEIAREAENRGVAVRVGVNSGSLERRLLGRSRKAEAEALARSALDGVALLEREGLSRIKISVKASDVPRTIDAYRLVSSGTEWPLHLGITEAGTLWSGTIKSSVGIGALLASGIGDTIRVSLTAPPVEEVGVGIKILESLGLRTPGLEVVSCPTCARAEIDVIDLATRVEKELEGTRTPLRVAVMGCAVNGPGEAREADIGLAGDKKGGLIFAGGKMVKRVGRQEMYEEFMVEVKRILQSRSKGSEGP